MTTLIDYNFEKCISDLKFNVKANFTANQERKVAITHIPDQHY